MHRLHFIFFLMAIGLIGPNSLTAQTAMTGQEGPLDGLFLLRESRTARISSYDRSGGTHDWVDIAPGETKTLAEISGTGVIRRFYMAPWSQDRMRYRKLILRIYWDGAKEPCVEVPLGDFFGSGLGTLRYFKSLVVNVNPGLQSWDFDGLVSYFPMPFQDGARITLENDGSVPDFRIWYHFDYEQYPDGKLPSDAGRFHAQWRRVARTPVREEIRRSTAVNRDAVANTTGEDNYVVLDTKGQGNFVGLFLTVDNLAGGWYGEGDDMVFVDGDRWPPAYPGTGHEEIFNSGCCPDKEFAGPYSGFYLIENRGGNFSGKNQMYRFYVNDPIRFQKSIRFTIEHGHANNLENDYTSTAFWYQKDPHAPFPRMPGARERLPSWPEGVAQALEVEAKLQDKIFSLTEQGKIHPSPEDQKRLRDLEGVRNKEFRRLDFRNYLRDVRAFEILANKVLPPGAR
jgi:D-arabinan exo alpha-(1,3)/(1,5)-arabinofuranosidase (non-reducing end)